MSSNYRSLMTLDDIFATTHAVADPTATPDAELRELADEIGGPIQRIQDLAGRHVRDAARIRFPRGYLIEIGRWRRALGFVRTHFVRSSVADALMMHDVQSWLLKRTDLAGHARDMMAKAAIASLGGIAEALLVDATTPPMGKRQRVASRIAKLEEEGVITGANATDLKWLWEIRNRQHVHGLTVREYDVYTHDDHPRAEAAVAALIVALQPRTNGRRE
jgi:hypothetical protein